MMLPNSDRAEMNDIIDHLNAVLDEDEQAAHGALADETPGRWVVGRDEHQEYVEVLGALREDARPGDGYWHGVCSWDVANIALEMGIDDEVGMDRVEREHQQLAAHIARHDPARVLREVEVIRRVIDDYRIADRACMRSDDPMSPEYATIRAGRDALKGVLLAYAGATGWKRDA